MAELHIVFDATVKAACWVIPTLVASLAVERVARRA